MRGGGGIGTYQLTEKTGMLTGISMVTDDDDIMLIASDGVVIRLHTHEINSYKRRTQGVRIMRMEDGVKLVSIAQTERESENEENDEENGGDTNE